MKKRILCVLHLPPPIHGATMVGKYIQESALLNNEFDIDYINLSTSTQLIDGGKKSIKKLFLIIRVQWQIIRHLLANRYDLCYVTLNAKAPGLYKDMLGVALLKLFRQNIVYHMHNKGVSLSDNQINNFFYRFAFKNTQTIITSGYLKADIHKYVSDNHIHVCPNGVPELIPSSFIKEKEYIGRKPQLLFLSNMMIEKGILILLDACKILRDKGISFECNYVGEWFDITENEFKNKVISLGLSEQVFVHGKKYGQDKIPFLKEADIFVLPTYYHNECLPLVILEAMQYGLPVISTPEGGIADVVIDGKTGFLVSQKDTLSIANRIEQLITQAELARKMGMEGRKHYEEKYTLDKFENRLCEILTKI